VARWELAHLLRALTYPCTSWVSVERSELELSGCPSCMVHRLLKAMRLLLCGYSHHDFASMFFSSRRRHTRFSRDWSSDVCSSDLAGPGSATRRRRPAWCTACTRRHGRHTRACPPTPGGPCDRPGDCSGPSGRRPGGRRTARPRRPRTRRPGWWLRGADRASWGVSVLCDAGRWAPARADCLATCALAGAYLERGRAVLGGTAPRLGSAWSGRSAPAPPRSTRRTGWPWGTAGRPDRS